MNDKVKGAKGEMRRGRDEEKRRKGKKIIVWKRNNEINPNSTKRKRKQRQLYEKQSHLEKRRKTKVLMRD